MHLCVFLSIKIFNCENTVQKTFENIKILLNWEKESDGESLPNNRRQHY